MFKASKLQSDPNPPVLAVSAIFTNPAFNLSTTSSKALLSGYEEVPIDA